MDDPVHQTVTLALRKQAHIVVKRVSDRRCKHVAVARASLGGSILLAKKLFDPSTILHFSLRSDYGLAPSARAPRFWAGMLTVGRTARRPAVLGRPPHGRLPPPLLEAEEKSGQQRGRLEEEEGRGKEGRRGQIAGPLVGLLLGRNLRSSSSSGGAAGLFRAIFLFRCPHDTPRCRCGKIHPNKNPRFLSKIRRVSRQDRTLSSPARPLIGSFTICLPPSLPPSCEDGLVFTYFQPACSLARSLLSLFPFLLLAAAADIISRRRATSATPHHTSPRVKKDRRVPSTS